MVVSIAYVIMLFGGQYIMKKREEVKLYWTLIGWNILQSLFSYAVAYYFWIDGGALATIQHLDSLKECHMNHARYSANTRTHRCTSSVSAGAEN